MKFFRIGIVQGLGVFYDNGELLQNFNWFPSVSDLDVQLTSSKM